ncbi:MAG: hypothetical protein AAF985_27525, partial [Bacteroidota bacterium]
SSAVTSPSAALLKSFNSADSPAGAEVLTGGGSRGNGQVNIQITSMDERGLAYYKNEDGQQKPLERTAEIPQELKQNKSEYA